MTRLNLFLLICCTCFWTCEQALINASPDSPTEIFEALWNHVDKNYIYFDLKQVDWNQIHDQYAPQVTDDMDQDALFNVCSTMLNELRDGHNSLYSDGTGFVKYDHKAGFEILFDLTVVKNNYLNDNFQAIGNYTYGIINDDIGYIHYADFSGVRNIATVMESFLQQNLKGIILDLRSNGGGRAQDAEDIVSYFIDQDTNIGYIQEKTGPAHSDISEPFSIQAEPTDIYFDLPVILISNRQSFSATSYLIGMMQPLQQVQLVGQISGGGGGGNESFELPNGWLLTLSVSKFVDINFQEIELGNIPDIPINNNSISFSNGQDKMLQRAIDLL